MSLVNSPQKTVYMNCNSLSLLIIASAPASEGIRQSIVISGAVGGSYEDCKPGTVAAPPFAARAYIPFGSRSIHISKGH